MRRLLLAVPLVTTLLTLVPLAYASPGDPTWIAGLYDNGDGDDVILLITSSVWGVDDAPPLMLDWLPRADAIVTVGPPPAVVHPAPAPLSVRAPPVP